MKIRNKLIVLQIFTLLIFILTIISYQHIQLREQRLYINSKIKSDELIIDNVLKYNEDRFLGAAKTNSCWNEIVDFALKPDTAWAKPAIEEIVSTFDLNYALVVDSSKKNIYDIYNKCDEIDNHISITPEMITILFGKSAFCHFFIETKTGYEEIFGSTIVRVDDSQHKGKAFGYLLIGKLWNSQFIKEIENVTGFKINVSGYLQSDTTKIIKDSKNNILVQKIIDDWQNKPLAKIAFKIKNKLIEEFYFSKYLSFFIAFFSILTVLLFFVAVRKWISKPLSHITNSLNTENISFLDNLIVKKNEFGEIAKLIKQFYLQKHNLENEIKERLNVEEQLKKANENLEHKVNERTNDLVLINSSLQEEIAERENAEAIIKKQMADLEAKNVEMESFTYTVSHDLKSPLITINGFAGVILEKIKNAEYEDLDIDLNRIVNATGKMQELLKDLLELSRIGRMSSVFAQINMNILVNEVVELLQGIIKAKNINIIVEENLPDVTADKQRIKEVVQNLIENAVKFMNNKENAFIKIGFKKINNENAFFVQDNGVGIDEKYHQKIFGLFDKLNQHSEGTGIGLALVKRIIELHNGKVWVESELNKGSTFYFTINKQKLM